MSNEFRLRQSCLIVGILLAIEFSVFGVGSVFVSAWNIDGSFSYPLLTATFHGLFWGFMFVGSLLMIAGYFRERLILSPASVFQQRVFRKSTLQLNEIIHLQWRYSRKSGIVMLRTSDQRIKINLRNFTDEDQRRIISLLQSAVPESIQEEWAQPAGTETQKSWAIALACAVMFAVMGGVSICYWSRGLGLHWFFVGVGNIAASLWYLWRIRTFVTSGK